MERLPILLLMPVALMAQIGGVSTSGVTRSVVRGTALPAKCSIGQVFFKTNADPGANLHGCTSANTWTMLGGVGTGLAVLSGDGAPEDGVTGGDLGQLYVDTTASKLYWCDDGDADTWVEMGLLTHASTHVTGGSDVIASVVAGGAAGLMTGADKTKLDGVAAGAEVNVNADWSSSSGDSQILNKPTLGDAAAKNTGTAAGTVAAGNDSRFTDARTPTAHATSHVSTGGDAIAAVVAAGASGLMTGADKTKLDGIAAGAEVNVNADWSALSGDAAIQNKPTLGGAAALEVGTTAGTVAAGNDSRFTDSRTPTSHASTHAGGGADAIANAVAAGAAGLMTGADKTKLDGVAAGAEVNVNADWNSATGDSQILNKPSNLLQYSGARTETAVTVYDSSGAILSSGCTVSSGLLSCGDGTEAAVVSFPELAANGSSETGIYGAESLSGNVCIVLPATQPTEGLILKGTANTATPTGTALTCRVMEWAADAGGMADPGSNGIVKRTALNTTAVASAGTDYVVPAGNVATSTALAANGSNCSAGQAAGGVSASGAAEDCTAYQASDSDLTTLAGKTIQGNGSDIRLTTGSFVVGNAVTTDASGNLVDSGSAPGGGTAGVGTGSGTLNFNSISDGACADLTFTFSGITTSSHLTPGFPSTLETGLVGQMWPSAADTVKVRICNFSGATVNPAEQTFYAKLANYYLTGSGTINFSSINDGACASSTITVTGAATGDAVVAGWPSTLETGIIGTMYVSSANTVTVRACNWYGSAVDPASQTFAATIAK